MKKLILSLACVSTLCFSCSDDDSSPASSTLNLDLKGLVDLGSKFAYEGWIIVDGSPVSTGTFSVNSSGELSQTAFDIDAMSLKNAEAFVLSIEPVPDSDPAPSNTKILGGGFSGASANVNIMHPAAFGGGFTDAKGGYILKTPTTTSEEDDLSGVWFLDPSGPKAGLELPDLSGIAGWTYEGWAVINGTPVSTGTFDKAVGKDNSAAFSGSDTDGPTFPGEDFIKNAPTGLTFPTNLQGSSIVVSIEPVPDNSDDPFVLKPLSGKVPADLGAGTFTKLNNIAASTYPSGTVKR